MARRRALTACLVLVVTFVVAGTGAAGAISSSESSRDTVSPSDVGSIITVSIPEAPPLTQLRQNARWSAKVLTVLGLLVAAFGLLYAGRRSRAGATSRRVTARTVSGPIRTRAPPLVFA